MSATESYQPLASRPRQRTITAGIFLLLISVHARLAAAIPALSPHNSSASPKTTSSGDDRGLQWYYLGTATGLVLLGGLFAGLTIALMSQDGTYLTVIASSGDGKEKRDAARVLWLLSKGKHWVLVTLLLCNVITNETLPIILHKSMGGGGWIAVVTSTVLIVVFGEIVPQAICVRYGLLIGAWTAPLVLGMMFVMSPVAWPAAKVLDRFLGEDTHGTMYRKPGLKSLIELHKTAKQLIEDEATIISSTLDLKDKPLSSIMTNIEHVFTLSTDTTVDETIIAHILQQGYSRIPVHTPHDPGSFTGMLLVRQLIGYSPADRKEVRDFSLVALPETSASTSCLDILNYFQEGKSHMVLISSSPGRGSQAIGIVTLEDVLEEIIGEEIIDESDVFDQTHQPLKRLLPVLKRQEAQQARSLEQMDESEDIGLEQDRLLPSGTNRQTDACSRNMVERSTVVNGIEKVVLEIASVPDVVGTEGHVLSNVGEN